MNSALRPTGRRETAGCQQALNGDGFIDAGVLHGRKRPFLADIDSAEFCERMGR